MIMRPEINSYYMVTDNQRQYLFQHHCSQHQNLHQHHNQRNFSNQNNIQRQQHQYQNVSQITTKESVHLCNPFEESSLSTSQHISSSHSNMVSTYPDHHRHSSTG